MINQQFFYNAEATLLKTMRIASGFCNAEIKIMSDTRKANNYRSYIHQQAEAGTKHAMNIGGGHLRKNISLNHNFDYLRIHRAKNLLCMTN